MLIKFFIEVNKDFKLNAKVEKEASVSVGNIMYADFLINDKLVLEVNGPYHFVTLDRHRKPLDKINIDIFKHFLGYDYEEINFFDWDFATEEVKTEKIKSLLNNK